MMKKKTYIFHPCAFEIFKRKGIHSIMLFFCSNPFIYTEDIDYGIKISRDFTDSTEHELDATSMINVHNYEVGRRVLKSNVDLTCKCHGVSGSCVVRTCWKRLGSFRDIGDEIIGRYERATHVQLTNQSRSSRSKLRPVKRGARKPNKKDLVFIDESPDYCTEDKR